MLEKYKNYKDIKMPDDMKTHILENMREYTSSDGATIKQQPTIKRRFLICVAIFALFAMACTAAYTTIVSNRVI